MNNKLTTAIIFVALVTSAVSANAAGKLVAPGQTPLKAYKAQMAIKNPITNTCPATARMAIWIFTNKPGPVNYMIAKKGGNVSGPFTLQSKKGTNGLSMATFSKSYEMHQPVDTQYRVLVSGTNGKVMSNWVRMKASCKIKLGG